MKTKKMSVVYPATHKCRRSGKGLGAKAPSSAETHCTQSIFSETAMDFTESSNSPIWLELYECLATRKMKIAVKNM